MKKTVFFMAAMALCLFATAQVRATRYGDSKTVRPQTFRLANGLKVIVAEDHSEPKVYGAVIVHAGSKNEDTAATGVAHYFEHIMFKGTDRIGTVDWERERPYLDSISLFYDDLQTADHDTTRAKIQAEINRLNIEASKFAIANETDAILQQMGCTGLNAGTTYDYTVYYNTLPSNQLENWMEVYAERFRNPVYRLFQGELEAVYEERNIYNNDMFYSFSRNLFTESFGQHPYSRDIIGLDEHLKRPQPSAMRKFYDKYYVASNMTLLLVGDLNVAQAKQMAERYFGVWPAGKRVSEPRYELPRFESRVVKNVKQTPIKVGLMVFPGVKEGNRDQIALEAMCELLSSEGGMLSRMVSEGKLMAATMLPLTLQDAGSNVLLYAPKLLGQKHEQAEELVWECIDSMKTGGFDDRQLDAFKTRRLVENQRQLESIDGLASLLEKLECTGSGYEQWLDDQSKLAALTKADISRVAREYFDRDHCTIVRSSMGLPKKEAAIKPEWEHLDAQNQGRQSDFAKRIASHKVDPVTPQEIDFQRVVAQVQVSPFCRLYAAPNPRNGIFTLTIAYHYGTVDNLDIEPAVNYFNRIGAGVHNSQQYATELDCLGARFKAEAGYDYTTLTISGPEQNMDDIMRLVMLKMHHPMHDRQQLKNMIEEAELAKKAAADDPDTWFAALHDYVDYGKQSPYIDHTTLKQLKKLDGEQLFGLMQDIFGRDGYVTFVGNTRPEDVAAMLRTENLVHETVHTVPQRIRIPASHSENEVFYVSNSQFLKSDVALTVQSRDFDYRADRAAAALFNEYMSGGMNGVLFQEIREFRALGYHTFGLFVYDHRNRFRSSFLGYLGTQADKTNDGIDAMYGLMTAFPVRKDKFVPSREQLVASRNANYIGFRNLPAMVRLWREEYNLDADPRQALTAEIANLRFDELEDFHSKYISGRPVVVLVSGSAKKFKVKELSAYGKMKKLKYKDIMKF